MERLSDGMRYLQNTDDVLRDWLQVKLLDLLLVVTPLSSLTRI